MRCGFGEYVLDTDRYELHRQGTPVSLAPQAFQLLTYLIEHRDRMVTKEELHEQVWQSKYVVDAALITCIAAVRQVLEDRKHQLIKTVHRRGYRFTASIREHLEQGLSQWDWPQYQGQQTRFTEGFATADLQEVKGLLAALGGEHGRAQDCVEDGNDP
jgi:DNA-binding winged helix-turn-helix (wHTH) protein